MKWPPSSLALVKGPSKPEKNQSTDLFDDVLVAIIQVRIVLQFEFVHDGHHSIRREVKEGQNDSDRCNLRSHLTNKADHEVVLAGLRGAPFLGTNKHQDP